MRFQVFGNGASERRGRRNLADLSFNDKSLPESLCPSACLPALFACLSACLSLSLHVSVSLHLFLSLAVSASSILFCLNHILALLVFPVQTEIGSWTYFKNKAIWLCLEEIYSEAKNTSVAINSDRRTRWKLRMVVVAHFLCFQRLCLCHGFPFKW